VTAAIAYLDGPRLRRSLIAAERWVAAGREELNRLNVFPVPDGDTGTNFWLTMRGVAEAMHRLGDAPLPEVSRAAAQAAVMGSRGNSGMMLSHFLVGFSEGLGERFRVRSRELAAAIRRGFQGLSGALEHPVEGTILTVCREAADEAERAAAADDDLGCVIRRTLHGAEAALQRTPELLATLREAGVVDAGGKGFVRILEGIVRLIDGQATEEAEADRAAFAPVPAATAAVEHGRDFRFCSEVLVRGPALPSSGDARRALHALGGDSLQVLRSGDLLRVHVHLDDPAPLFALGETWGEVLTRKAEDMRRQHRMLGVARRPVAVVSDTACDLPDELVDRYGIALVPLQLMFGAEVYQDRFGLDTRAFYRRLRRKAAVRPTTSQPTVQTFHDVLAHASAEADAVVGVILSSGLSGTFANAEAARRSLKTDRVTLVDSRGVSLSQGLLALKAAELAEAGWGVADIVAELARVRAHCGLLFTVATLENLVRSGRVSRAKGWIAGLLDLLPILSVDQDGRIEPVDRVRGRRAVLPRMLDLLGDALPAARPRLRVGIVHADCPDVAERVRHAVVERFAPDDVIVTTVTPVIAAHAGPGAWGIAWQVEDTGAVPAGNKPAAPAL